MNQRFKIRFPWFHTAFQNNLNSWAFQSYPNPMRIKDSPRSHPICSPHSQTGPACFDLSFCLYHGQALAGCPAGGPTALGDWVQVLAWTHTSNPVHLKQGQKSSAKVFFLSAFGFFTKKECSFGAQYFVVVIILLVRWPKVIEPPRRPVRGSVKSRKGCLSSVVMLSLRQHPGTHGPGNRSNVPGWWMACARSVLLLSLAI